MGKNSSKYEGFFAIFQAIYQITAYTWHQDIYYFQLWGQFTTNLGGNLATAVVDKNICTMFKKNTRMPAVSY